MAPDTAPLAAKITGAIPAAGAAVDQDTIIGEAPYAATVTGASFTPEAALTGATATKRTFQLIDKGADGLGATVVATLDTITGTDLVAFDEKAFTLSAVAGAVDVVAGAVLAVAETHASTGTAHSGGIITVEFTRA